MKFYSAFQYIKIDISSSFGLDKETYQVRLDWFEANKHQLHDLVNQAEEPAQFYAGILAYEDTLAGKPIGYLVGQDATASGLQCMAALTGCKVTAESVNLVDPTQRKDVYTNGHKVMQELLGEDISFERKDTKRSIMTSMYGSRKAPIDLFGEGTPALKAFYQMLDVVAPGAHMLKNDLINLWQPYALQHKWEMPDGFTCIVKVMDTKEESFEVNELKSSFTHRYKVNQGTEKGLSLAANVIHSVDALMVREINRRANYDPVQLERVYAILSDSSCEEGDDTCEVSEEFIRLLVLTQKHSYVSPVLLDHVTKENAHIIPLWIKQQLLSIIKQMARHKPFAVISIHDAYKCHPLYMNYVREYYAEVMAQIADSTMLSAMASQISGKQVPVVKLSNDLSKYIRQSEYMLS